MILGFKKTFPWGEPTNFREKILAGVGMAVVDWTIEGTPIIRKRANGWTPKIHTIRSGNRWKAGDLIHMAYGVRSKNYEQFNKGIEGLQMVVSVQEIEMEWTMTKKDTILFTIKIDGKSFRGMERLSMLAINDGFLTLQEFYRWFHKDFSGQIIHWTDYRYK